MRNTETTLITKRVRAINTPFKGGYLEDVSGLKPSMNIRRNWGCTTESKSDVVSYSIATEIVLPNDFQMALQREFLFNHFSNSQLALNSLLIDLIFRSTGGNGNWLGSLIFLVTVSFHNQFVHPDKCNIG